MVGLLLCISGHAHRGLMAWRTKPPQSGAKRAPATGQAENRGRPSGGTDFLLERTGGSFSLPIRKAVGCAGKNRGEQPIHTEPRMALVILGSGGACLVNTGDSGDARRGRRMLCHAGDTMLQHADGERRLILKAQRPKEKLNSRVPSVVHERNQDRHYATAGYGSEGQELMRPRPASGWR